MGRGGGEVLVHKLLHRHGVSLAARDWDGEGKGWLPEKMIPDG